MSGKRPALFLDANILFSAVHDPNSRSAALVALAKGGRATLLTSAYAREEARRNLELKRRESLLQFNRHLQSVRVVQEVPADVVQQVAVQHGVPIADAPILAAALQARADYLVTGDVSHFGHLMDRRRPNLPVQFLSLRSALRLLDF